MIPFELPNWRACESEELGRRLFQLFNRLGTRGAGVVVVRFSEAGELEAYWGALPREWREPVREPENPLIHRSWETLLRAAKRLKGGLAFWARRGGEVGALKTYSDVREAFYKEQQRSKRR